MSFTSRSRSEIRGFGRTRRYRDETMPARRVLVFTLVLCFGAGLAHASEVDDAREVAEAAKTDRDQAAAANDEARAARDELADRVVDALGRLRRANEDAADSANRHIDLMADIGELEERAALLRGTINDRAVEAYMRSAFGTSLVLWQAESFEEVALLSETAREAAESSHDEIATLRATRVSLEGARQAAATEAARTAELTRYAEGVHDELEALFLEADAVAAATLANLELTEIAYGRALTELEEAERRAAALAGVEHWRPLVETHFPPDLVEEALRVMKCESGGNPDAVNASSGASGLFQFLDTTWAWAAPQAGMAGRSRFDPVANVASAAWLVDYTIRTNHPRGRWAHWTCQP